MARLEADRDDLIAEATALVPRAEFDIPGQPDHVVAGYRKDGGLSLYFGPDPCYHFDPGLRLRRAFVDGALYRTQGQTLARLRRLRNGPAVELLRHDLTDRELQDFCRQTVDRLRQICAALQSGAPCVRQVPAEADLTAELLTSLNQLLQTSLKLAPAIRGKR